MLLGMTGEGSRHFIHPPFFHYTLHLPQLSPVVVFSQNHCNAEGPQSNQGKRQEKTEKCKEGENILVFKNVNFLLVSQLALREIP